MRVRTLPATAGQAAADVLLDLRRARAGARPGATTTTGPWRVARRGHRARLHQHQRGHGFLLLRVGGRL